MTLRRTHPRILIVEGRDELRVLPELLELAGVAWPKGAEPVRMAGWVRSEVNSMAGVDLRSAAVDP